jgi:hypothetical protein
LIARRFRLATLPAPLRPAAVGVLVVIGAWSAVIALNAAGLGVKPDALTNSSSGLMAAPGWGPPFVRVGTVVALAVGAVGAALSPGWPDGRATRVLRRGILAAVTAVGFALVLLSLAAVALLLTLLGYRLLIGSLDPTVDMDNALFSYTRGFTTELILLPLGFTAVALRLQGSPRPARAGARR